MMFRDTDDYKSSSVGLSDTDRHIQTIVNERSRDWR
jgi:hypothetical protein